MASDTLIDIGTLVVVDPDFRNGRPCIAGTGMSVHAVARLYLNGEPAQARASMTVWARVRAPSAAARPSRADSSLNRNRGVMRACSSP